MDEQNDDGQGAVRDVELWGDGTRSWKVKARTPSDAVQIATAALLKQMEGDGSGEDFIADTARLKRAVRRLVVDPADWELIEDRLLSDGDDALDFFELLKTIIFPREPNREQRRAEARAGRPANAGGRQSSNGRRRSRGGRGRRD